MNERIQKLADKAIEDMPGVWNIPDEFCEKFAGLIVRECAGISEDDITDGDACCTTTASRIARQIKNHFGVEQ